MTIAVDLGYGNVKLYGGAVGAQTVVLPSQVATNGREVVHGTALEQGERPMEVRTAHGSFLVGLGAHDWGRPVENLALDRFVGTPEMRALLYGALSQYPMGHALETDLIVGLPLGVLSGEEETVRGRVAEIRGFLQGEHRWLVDGERRSLQVGEVKIASQADGTLFDYLLEEDGSMPPERKQELGKEIGILNVGFCTVDLLVARAGRTVQRFTAGDTRGVRRLLSLVGDGLYSLGELDAELRAGTLDVDEALPVWAREVTGLLDDQWGKSWRRFVRVIASGGGAVLLRNALIRAFGGRLWLPESPVLATARGLWKLAKMQSDHG